MSCPSSTAFRQAHRPTPPALAETRRAGALRVADCNAATAGLPFARMTSGASANNSFVFARGVGIACSPAVIEPHVAADAPAQLLQSLGERSNTGRRLQIIRGEGHQHADPPYTLALRAQERTRRTGWLGMSDSNSRMSDSRRVLVARACIAKAIILQLEAAPDVRRWTRLGTGDHQRREGSWE